MDNVRIDITNKVAYWRNCAEAARKNLMVKLVPIIGIHGLEDAGEVAEAIIFAVVAHLKYHEVLGEK